MTWPSCVKTNTADNPDNTTRPKELILDIHLPLLDSAAGVDLDVQERSLVLERAEPPRYELRLPLPYPVDEASGSAKFDKGTRRLTVSLPIKAAMMAVPKTERLSSNDSGIDLVESDDSYRTTMFNDGAAEPENSNSGGDDDDKPSEKAEAGAVLVQKDNSQDYRTTVGEVVAVVEKDDFLDASVTYSLPLFSCVVQPPVISFTLEVKNVDPSSIVQRVWLGGVAVRFASLGSGLYPLHHAFAVQFQEPVGKLDEVDLEIGRWTWDKKNSSCVPATSFFGICWSRHFWSALAITDNVVKNV